MTADAEVKHPIHKCKITPLFPLLRRCEDDEATITSAIH
jgi:hypothetical protein